MAPNWQNNRVDDWDMHPNLLNQIDEIGFKSAQDECPQYFVFVCPDGTYLGANHFLTGEFRLALFDDPERWQKAHPESFVDYLREAVTMDEAQLLAGNAGMQSPVLIDAQDEFILRHRLV